MAGAASKPLVGKVYLFLTGCSWLGAAGATEGGICGWGKSCAGGFCCPATILGWMMAC